MCGEGMAAGPGRGVAGEDRAEDSAEPCWHGIGSALPDWAFGRVAPELEARGFQPLPISLPHPSDPDRGKKPPGSLAELVDAGARRDPPAALRRLRHGHPDRDHARRSTSTCATPSWPTRSTAWWSRRSATRPCGSGRRPSGCGSTDGRRPVRQALDRRLPAARRRAGRQGAQGRGPGRRPAVRRLRRPPGHRPALRLAVSTTCSTSSATTCPS